jgi:hypothetical protein
MKAYWGSGGIAPLILDLGTRWRWVVSFTPRPLYPQGKSPWYPLNRRLGGPQSRSRRGGEEKNSQPLPGLEHPIIQPVSQCYFWKLIFIVLIFSTEQVSAYKQKETHGQASEKCVINGIVIDIKRIKTRICYCTVIRLYKCCALNIIVR